MVMHDRARATADMASDEPDADAAEIRYGLTPLGEALIAEEAGPRFRGFGPCSIASREMRRPSRR